MLQCGLYHVEIAENVSLERPLELFLRNIKRTIAAFLVLLSRIIYENIKMAEFLDYLADGLLAGVFF